MKKLFCFFLFCFGINFVLVAQTKDKSALYAIIHKERGDSAHFMALNLLADSYRFAQPDSCLYYASKVTAAPSKASSKQIAAAHNSIGYAHYAKSEYPKAIEAFQRFYDFSAKINDKVNMGYALNNAGNVYIELGNYSQALKQYRDALALRQSIGDLKGIAMSYNNIGFVYKDLGDYDEAAENTLEGLRMLEKMGDKALIASSYTLLGALYMKKKDFAASIEYQQKALTIQKEIGNNEGMAMSYAVMAGGYGEQEKYQESMEAYTEALNLYRKVNDLRQIGTIEANIGELLARQNDFKNSIPYYDTAIDLSQKTGNRRSLANFWLGQAQNYLELKKVAEARLLLDSATKLTAQTGRKDYLKSIYELEARYHALIGDYPTALQFAYKLTAQKDTLLNAENLKSMNGMQVRYETEKKQAQIELLGKESVLKALQIRNQKLLLEEQLFKLTEEQLALSQAALRIANGELLIKNQNQQIIVQKADAQERARHLDSLQKVQKIQGLEITNRKLELRQRNGIIVSLSLLMLLGTLLGYSYYRRQKLKANSAMQAAILKQQEEATRAILNAEETERIRIAKDLHDGVGQMMSAAKMNLSAFEQHAAFKNPTDQNALARIISLVDESCNEVRAVSHNMMPNALLKNSLAAAVREFINQIDQRKLKVHLYTEGLENRLDQNTETILYRIIQECVNNVMKHAKANTLDISLIKEASEITVTVEDNGLGFDSKIQPEGIGLKNIRTRVEYLRGSVDFSSEKGKGTLVALHFPLA
ncbi:MAG: tetratricopeptide repeat protein [Chitinophagaceae bacterium]